MKENEIRLIAVDNKDAASINRLESEIADNKKRILFVEKTLPLDSSSKEYRRLLLERGKLKDELLEAYRKVMS